MSGERRTARLVAAVTGLIVGPLALAVPTSASATVSQAWSSSASYRASEDFVATSSSLVFGGTACGGGGAAKYYVQLVKTSNNSKVKSSRSWSASTNAWNYQYGSGTSAGTAYYMRWYGQNGSGSNGYSAPCQGIVYSD